MVQKTAITLFDDFDPDQPADETLQFGLAGVWYEIDVTTERADEFRQYLHQFITRGRRLKPTMKTGSAARNRPARRATSEQSPDFVREVRAWFRSTGREIPDRGRISAAQIAEYQAAMDATPTGPADPDSAVDVAEVG